jgi:hypothetical protein
MKIIWSRFKARYLTKRGFLVGLLSSIIFLLFKFGSIYIFFTGYKTIVLYSVTTTLWLVGGIYTVFRFNRRMQIRKIINGWKNYYKDKYNLLKPDIKAQAEDRYEICRMCHLNNNDICNEHSRAKHIKTNEWVYGCGCPLPKKVLSEDSECPTGKWGPMK